ncbi:unnamed protein product [Paramecium sonneborni]|uniref:Uncharacterized protein n=1 Tax=Paramecium sonneborni TaxID=65129 RepID=A0A8S1RSP9_9CILI|nr:unnamed protein product [Paramecium sonneborni]
MFYLNFQTFRTIKIMSYAFAIIQTTRNTGCTNKSKQAKKRMVSEYCTNLMIKQEILYFNTQNI